ncbi:MAG: hypothetical protein FJ265_19215 [Planctomycetes bacterium]|nr:hypothetical protein [Planctomycetota bacterium]
MKARPGSAPLLLSLAVLAPSCSVGAHESIGSVRGSLDLTEPVAALVVTLDAGSIRIERGAATAVVVEAEVLRRGGAAADFAGELRFADHVRLARNGDRVEVTSAHDLAADAGDWQLRLTVRAPEAIALRAGAKIGQLVIDVPDARSIEGRLGIGDAAVTADAVAERVDLDVGIGNASATIRHGAPQQGMRLACRTGSVAARLPERVNGTFALRTGVGDVRCAARFGLDRRRAETSAEAKGRLGDGEAVYELVTGVGNVTLD